MRLEKILFTVVIVMLLSACGGGSSSSGDSGNSSKNHALQFDGATKQQKYVADRLDLGKLEGIAVNSTDTFSISLYVHFDSFSKENPNLENARENTSWGYQTIIGNSMAQPSGRGHFGVYVTETDGVLDFGFNVSQIPRGKLVSYNLKELDKNILDYKMCFTFDGTIAKIYIDGEEVGSTIVGNIGGNANTANWTVGNAEDNVLDDYRVTGDLAFKGVIDDIMFYNRALDDVEVQQLMNGIELTNGLVAKYDFEGTTPLKDKTGNGHDAQLTNTPTVIEWEY